MPNSLVTLLVPILNLQPAAFARLINVADGVSRRYLAEMVGIVHGRRDEIRRDHQCRVIG